MIPGFGKQNLTVGSGPSCDVVLNGEGVLPEHARIIHQGGGKLLFVNGHGPASANGRPSRDARRSRTAGEGRLPPRDRGGGGGRVQPAALDHGEPEGGIGGARSGAPRPRVLPGDGRRVAAREQERDEGGATDAPEAARPATDRHSRSLAAGA